MNIDEEVAKKLRSAEQDAAVDAAIEAFAVNGANTPCYLFGRNQDSEALLKMFPNVVGVIDDFCQDESAWLGVPLLSRSEVPLDALIVNAVTNSKPRQAQRSLESSGFERVHHVAFVTHAVEGVLAPNFVVEFAECLGRAKARWQQLYAILGDSTSKNVLLDIIAYRSSGNPACLRAYEFAPEKQYFEEFLSIKTEVFVDGGGCKGETTQLFASRFPDYQRIDIFEPDERNIVDASALASKIPRSCFHPIGLSDVSGTLYFDSGQGSSSSVSEEGDVAISVDALDNVLLDATFIKLDLEGWELHALKGSEQNIRANKPKLAIGAYHRPDDFLDISDWVLGVRPDYRVALRHYTESWTESVLYFY